MRDEQIAHLNWILGSTYRWSRCRNAHFRHRPRTTGIAGGSESPNAPDSTDSRPGFNASLTVSVYRAELGKYYQANCRLYSRVHTRWSTWRYAWTGGNTCRDGCKSYHVRSELEGPCALCRACFLLFAFSFYLAYIVFLSSGLNQNGVFGTMPSGVGAHVPIRYI
jgi:hypothetical protein